MKTLSLPNNLSNKLLKLPETGMGYQLVKVVLKNGKELQHAKVLNASLLILPNGEYFTNNDIEKIEPE